MYKLKLKIKEKIVEFSNLTFNEKEELEFRSVNIDFLKGHTFVFNETKENLEVRGDCEGFAFISLKEEQVKELKRIKEETREYVINLYKGILKGEERLLFLEAGLDDFPYIITSPSILNAKIKSPKYNNALLYVFSDSILKTNNKTIDFNFSNYEEFQKKLGKKIEKRKMKPNYKFEGQEVISLKWNQLVS